MIAAEDTTTLVAVLLALVAVSAWLESTRFGRKISAAAIIMIGALALSNFGIIPRSAPIYDGVWSLLVPLAVALFLLKADVMKVFQEGGRVLVAFLFGMVGTALGALLATAILDLGQFEAEYAAVYSATYIGGSLNFAAVAEIVGFTDPTALAAALAIDNVMGAGFIILINLLAGWELLHRRFAWRMDRMDDAIIAQSEEAQPDFSLVNFTSSLAVAAAAVAVSTLLARWLGVVTYSLLFLTVIVSIAATLGRKWFSKFRGEDILALIIMYLFFAVIGASADFASMLNAAPQLFIAVLLIFTVHILFVLAAGVIFKINVAELAVASLACITGPPVAAAFAVAMNWRSLIAPAILTGIFGYVVGNFVGVGIFAFLTPK
jgi:uncharacterized membrane protein